MSTVQVAHIYTIETLKRQWDWPRCVGVEEGIGVEPGVVLVPTQSDEAEPTKRKWLQITILFHLQLIDIMFDILK